MVLAASVLQVAFDCALAARKTHTMHEKFWWIAAAAGLVNVPLHEMYVLQGIIQYALSFLVACLALGLWLHEVFVVAGFCYFVLLAVLYHLTLGKDAVYYYYPYAVTTILYVSYACVETFMQQWNKRLAASAAKEDFRQRMSQRSQ